MEALPSRGEWLQPLFLLASASKQSTASLSQFIAGPHGLVAPWGQCAGGRKGPEPTACIA